MATIHICDRCGERPFERWYGLTVYVMNEDCRDTLRSESLDLCYECYRKTVKEFASIKESTPDVEVVVK